MNVTLLQFLQKASNRPIKSFNAMRCPHELLQTALPR